MKKETLVNAIVLQLLGSALIGFLLFKCQSVSSFSRISWTSSYRSQITFPFIDFKLRMSDVSEGLTYDLGGTEVDTKIYDTNDDYYYLDSYNKELRDLYINNKTQIVVKKLYKEQKLGYTLVKQTLLHYQLLYGDMLVSSNFVVPDTGFGWPKKAWGVKLGVYAYTYFVLYTIRYTCEYIFIRMREYIEKQICV